MWKNGRQQEERANIVLGTTISFSNSENIYIACTASRGDYISPQKTSSRVQKAQNKYNLCMYNSSLHLVVKLEWSVTEGAGNNRLCKASTSLSGTSLDASSFTMYGHKTQADTPLI